MSAKSGSDFEYGQIPLSIGQNAGDLEYGQLPLQIGGVEAAPDLAISVSDAIGVVDTPACFFQSINVEVTDSVHVADIPIMAGNIYISVYEDVHAEDVPYPNLNCHINVADAITKSESRSVAIAWTINVSDAVTISEPATTPKVDVVLCITLFDGVHVDESLDVLFPTHSVQVSDTISISESLVVLSEPILYVSVSDSVTVSESHNLHLYSGSDLLVQVSDSVRVTELRRAGIWPIRLYFSTVDSGWSNAGYAFFYHDVYGHYDGWSVGSDFNKFKLNIPEQKTSSALTNYEGELTYYDSGVEGWTEYIGILSFATDPIYATNLRDTVCRISLRAIEDAAASNAYVCFSVLAVSPDDTDRQFLWHFTTPPHEGYPLPLLFPTEINATKLESRCASRTLDDDVDCEIPDGWRILVEIGFVSFVIGATVNLNVGDSAASDLAWSDSDDDADNPWIEFGAPIIPYEELQINVHDHVHAAESRSVSVSGWTTANIVVADTITISESLGLDFSLKLISVSETIVVSEGDVEATIFTPATEIPVRVSETIGISDSIELRKWPVRLYFHTHTFTPPLFAEYTDKQFTELGGLDGEGINYWYSRTADSYFWFGPLKACDVPSLSEVTWRMCMEIHQTGLYEVSLGARLYHYRPGGFTWAGNWSDCIKTLAGAEAYGESNPADDTYWNSRLITCTMNDWGSDGVFNFKEGDWLLLRLEITGTTYALDMKFADSYSEDLLAEDDDINKRPWFEIEAPIALSPNLHPYTSDDADVSDSVPANGIIIYEGGVATLIIVNDSIAVADIPSLQIPTYFINVYDSVDVEEAYLKVSVSVLGGNIWVKVGGEWVLAQTYTKVGGSWQLCTIWVNDAGTWKETV